MRVFHCDRCTGVVDFDAHRCPQCDAPLGYLDQERTVRMLEPTADPAVFTVRGEGQPLWRCLNAAWGCNWTLPAGTESVWCRSCQMTRGRPDDGRPDAIAAWMTAEAAKRRLIHQLDDMALPVEIRSSTPDGLAFDLVYLPGEGGITGHLGGVVTLDLAETDDAHRDELRRRLGEPFRTVIGHLRHEIAHHYFARLVGQTDDLARFRHLFGDERDDYRRAVERYYSGDVDPWDPNRYITAYAASHPLEDWAETFAHYLHIIDVTDTALARDLVPSRGSRAALDRGPLDGGPLDGALGLLELDEILEAWRPLNEAVNAIAEAVGAPAVYPFDPHGIVVDKLSFVHRQIAAHTERDRFYAIP